MSVTKEIERLRDYPQDAPRAFREQLERAQESKDKLMVPLPKEPGGIDRSRDLRPVARPALVRRAHGG
jgi:hypothetical protein